MNKGRMEAFSDGVIAIIITIMVLEFRVPTSADGTALLPMIPKLMSYVLTFVSLGTYWSNHHHLLQAVKHVNGKVLWANLHLLFWLSLAPFATGWMGEHPFTPWPVAVYGSVLFFSAVSYFILTKTLLALHGKDSTLMAAVGNDLKGQISLVIYLVAMPTAFLNPTLATGLYVLVAIWWLIPDRRIEKTMTRENKITS